MKFIFVCPEKNRIFESDNFKIIDHQGVKEDDAGNKFLDAKVELSSSCPFCGKKHIFYAAELMCPFEPARKNQETPSPGKE